MANMKTKLVSGIRDGELHGEAHDATRLVVNGYHKPYWVASYRNADNKMVVKDFGSEIEALVWLETEAKIRGLKFVRMN